MLIQGRFTYTLPGSTTLWRIYNARGVLALAWNPMLPICHTTRGSERVSIARPFDARRCVGVVACALGLWLTFGSNLLADVWEAFESADTAWQVAESDCALRKLVHERTWKEAHGGHASEHLHLSVGAGSKVYLTYDIEPARVIEELVPRLWLKSDRVGPQLFVRVVLPRTKEPRTGRPITALIPGDTYSDAGVWQPLSFKNVPLLLERQVRVLRQQFGSDIDPREAYIDKIVINAFSEPGPIKLWIDDLEVTGHVAVAERDKLLDATHRPVAFEEATSAPADRSVQLDGSLILAGGRPLPVRMIEHNGESLEWLQTAGFNAVWLREPATALQLTEAERLGLWLVAPPPTAQAGRITVTPAHASILAWSLGTKLGPLDVDTTRELARELRAADNVVGRPMIAGAIAPLAAYSRTANILLLDPPSLGGSFEMADYASWLAERPRFARPGTPCWAMLETEPAAEIYSQLAAVRPQIMPTPELDYQQLRLATFTAIASGARGILFQSRTRLDGQDRAAIQRIDTLRLLNAELRLVEPWMAAGTYVGEISVDDKQVRVSALQTERARLLVVRRYTNGQQFVIGGADKDRLSLVIPGTPSSSHVYRLSTLGMEPIVHKRITGGTHLAIESAGACSLVVITQDPLVLGRVARDLAALEAQHARLHYEVVLRKLETTGDAARRMPLNAFPNTSRALDQATANMQQALRLLSANDRRGAEKVVAAAELQLAEVQRGHLQAAALAFPSPIASAFCTQFNTLPVHYELSERLRTVTFGENVLPGGEMEELNSLIQSGWKHQRDPNVPVESAVELSPQPHGGQSSLHLSVFAGKPEDAPTLIETPPVWVTSPAIN
ncbi:MAG TPA: hypothetical protein VL096_11675, partial [Pirellulaceae bacterium]|nr:hypothetical protein [Pirellulaceae bacterium]